jgi:hypothetical protein
VDGFTPISVNELTSLNNDRCAFTCQELMSLPKT